jgi:putative ABC transport system permease protein
MNLATIAIRNTQRSLFRTLLTLLAIAVAMVALLLLRTFLAAWLTLVDDSAQDRVATRHKVTYFMQVPKRYLDDIAKVPGVQAATGLTWFGGHVPGKEDRFFNNQAVQTKTFFDVYDEVLLAPEQKARFLADRRGAIVGTKLARQFGWKLGDHITLEGSTYPGLWEFNIDGIYTTSRTSIDQSTFYFQWDYLNDSLPDASKEQFGMIISKVPSPREAARVSKRIDALFDSRDVQTLSMDERSMRASFMGMLSALLGAMQLGGLVILLIMMLIVGNTVAMSVRERTQEYGVLRAVGFLPKHIAGFVLGEATVLGLAGGILGLALSYPLINLGVGRYIAENYAGAFPHFRIPPLDLAIVLALSVLLATVAAVVPARQASKLHVIDALRNLN